MNQPLILFANVLIIATCGLIYELLAATVASYVLGDSITQFSFIIGLYLSAMGVGAWLSRYLKTDLARRFVEVELGVALLGGLAAPLLFFAFAHGTIFHLVLYSQVFLIGVLVGLEIPLLMRILKDQLEFGDLVSKVLSFDYLGALVASILFPILLVPKLGLIRTSLLFGLLNAAVGLWGTWLLAPLLKRGSILGLRIRGAFVFLLLLGAFIGADRLTRLSEDQLYADEVVYSTTSPYQRIVVTRGKAGFQLFLNGHLQFSSADEYRYHEALVHPAMLSHVQPRRILVLGGGDGLAVREVLRHPGVEQVTLVDLDPAVTMMANSFPPLLKLNGGSLKDPRVRIINQDAFLWVQEKQPVFDVALIDFPDPSAFPLGKLYTTRFFRMLKTCLGPEARIAIQSTSPLFARHSFWCIVQTLEASGFHVYPYHLAVPAFGVWGFALAGPTSFPLPATVPLNLKFLNSQSLTAMFQWSADMARVPVEVNRLDNQMLVRYYEKEWRRWE